jgi:hypothetical protein
MTTAVISSNLTALNQVHVLIWHVGCFTDGTDGSSAKNIFRMYSVRISAWTQTSLHEVFRGFPHSFWGNSGTAPRSGHDRFLPNAFQLFIHQSSCCPTINNLNTDNVVKQLNTEQESNSLF